MKKYLFNLKTAFSKVFSSINYLIIALLFALFIFAFNILITNYRLLFSKFSFQLLFSLLFGSLGAISKTSLILIIIMSLLAGVVLSKSIYLMKRQIKGSAGASSSSILASVIAPSCPSCAIGLLSTLGLGGFLVVLPFKGLELGIVGIILLLVSLFYLSGKIVTETCKVRY